MVVMITHIDGNFTRYFDCDVAEAAAMRASVYADEVFGTGRGGGVAMVFFPLRRREAEPAHAYCLAAADRDQCRIAWGGVEAALAVRDGGRLRERKLGRRTRVVWGDMDGDMDCESEVRNGAFESIACAKRGMGDT
jgi:hypothetical protein